MIPVIMPIGAVGPFGTLRGKLARDILLADVKGYGLAGQEPKGFRVRAAIELADLLIEELKRDK